MNERINELYEQAHEEQSPISGQGRLTKDILWEQPRKFNPEKFAELIVRECLDISHRESHLPDTVLFDERSDKFIKDIHNRVARATREHFGVEE